MILSLKPNGLSGHRTVNPQREYFYEIDADGRLFHDGSELTDTRFLDFFFTHLKPNPGPLHPEYAFLSPCGREMNYIKSSSPIVFRALMKFETGTSLLYAGQKLQPFMPEALTLDASGQLYHPTEIGIAGRLGRHALLEISKFIYQEEGRYWIRWNSEQYCIATKST
ncbi:DUF4505 family protein [Leptonema illini]|uniref:DUF4505 family protein n=1 Tax=Leptonema illini TaxID=183 RepID=UPI00069697D0|nr:DUF4505 family protein [Leptonema illini]